MFQYLKERDVALLLLPVMKVRNMVIMIMMIMIMMIMILMMKVRETVTMMMSVETCLSVETTTAKTLDNITTGKMTAVF